MLTHLSLFSGIGGIDLAAGWAGFETVAFVERNKFCQQVLAKHWPGVPIHDDVTTFDGRPFRGRVDLLTGGFPCQPYSQAGQRRGAEDDRALWPEMLRIVTESKPSWVVGENVAGFVSMGLDSCLSDLENQGYEVQPFLIPACGVGAPHQRYRVFIVANALGIRRDEGAVLCGRSPEGRALFNDSGCQGGHVSDPDDRGCRKLFQSFGQSECGNAANTGSDGEAWTMAHASRDMYARPEAQRSKRERVGECGESVAFGGEQWSTEPAVGRVAHGISRRVDRLRSLGNAVVPQQVYPILKGIADELTNDDHAAAHKDVPT